jgi:hypothetical protein
VRDTKVIARPSRDSKGAVSDVRQALRYVIEEQGEPKALLAVEGF